MDDQINGAPSPQVAAAPPGSIVVGLRKTVIANGDETKELVFREPTAGDIEYCGNPVDIDMAADPPKISFNTKSMTQMMARTTSAVGTGEKRDSQQQTLLS